MTATIEPGPSGPEPTTPTIDPDVTDYVNAVRTRLADIEADELDDLIDDLELHLVELRAESQAPFAELIGAPEHFADELRQSAGFPPAPTSTADVAGVEARIRRMSTRLEGVTSTIGQHRWSRAVVEFLPELRPAGWVARGYLLTVLVGVLAGRGALVYSIGVPRVTGVPPIDLVLTAAAIVGSIRFGRSRLPGNLPRLAAVAAGLLAGLAALLLADDANAVAYSGVVIDYADVPAADVEFFDEGSVLPANIHAYLPDGTPLDRVLLFDETGDPIELPTSGYSAELGDDFESPYQVDESGTSVANLYPRRLLVPDYDWEQPDDGIFRHEVEPPYVVFPSGVEDPVQEPDSAEGP